MLEAVHSSRSDRDRIPTIETASTLKEAQRVLAWQEEVARSTAASVIQPPATEPDAPEDDRPAPTTRRAETFPRTTHAERGPRLVRREIVTTEHYRDRDRDREWEREREREPVERRAEEGSRFSGMKAAESPQLGSPPRRASHGDRGSDNTRSRIVETVRVERGPPSSYLPAKDRTKYVEYRIAPPPAPSAAMAQDMARLEERSYVTRRSTKDSDRGFRARGRSEVGTRYDRPLSMLPPRPASPEGSHASYRSRKSRSSIREADRETYMSARSQRTGMTVKPAQYVTAPTSEVTAVRIAPKHDDPRSEISYARRIPLPRSEVTARQVPLPRSMVSGRGYTASVAPSDSKFDIDRP